MSGVVFDSVLAKWSAGRKRKWAWITAAFLFLPLFASTSWYLLASQNREVKANEDSAYFVSNEIMDGLKILRERTKPDDVVLAMPGTTRLIPAFSGNTVVWGHWAMSIDYKERQASLAKLFDKGSNLDDEAKAREFWENDIQIIFADGTLKQSIEQYPFVWRVILKDARKIFENNSVVIYQRSKQS